MHTLSTESIGLRLGSLLLVYAERHNLGRVTCGDADAAPETDVLFFGRRSGDAVEVPDLALVVWPPGVKTLDIFPRLIAYMRRVPVVGLVNVRRRMLSLYRGCDQEYFGINDTLTLPDVLPGFSLLVREIFE